VNGTPAGESTWTGYAPVAVVATREEREVQDKLRAALKGHTIDTVIYGSGKLVLMLDTGLAFTVATRDGFTLGEES